MFIFHVVEADDWHGKPFSYLQNQLHVLFSPRPIISHVIIYIYVSFGYINKLLNRYTQTCLPFCLKQFQNMLLPILC